MRGCAGWLGLAVLHACQTDTAPAPAPAPAAAAPEVLLSTQQWAALSGPQPGPHDVWTQACGGEQIAQDYVIQPSIGCRWHVDAQGQRSDTRRDCTLEDYCRGPEDCRGKAGGVCVGSVDAQCIYPELELSEPCQADAACKRFANGRCMPSIEPGVERCYPDGRCVRPESGYCLYPPLNQETCLRDADCSSLAAGRCQLRLGNSQCLYNECAVDADCGPGARCHCQGDGQRCLPAECFQDAECGPGYRCMASPPVLCGNIFPPVGYYCHGPADECQSDADCLGNSSCSYDPTAGSWACGEFCFSR